MEIQIELEVLVLIIIGIIAAVALVYLILVLNNIYKITKDVKNVLESNSKNINETLNNLPAISSDVAVITDNVKDLTNVATEITADAIVAKDSILDNVETIKDIINIVLNVFIKK